MGLELGERPGAQRRLQGRGVDLLQDAPQRRLVGHHRAYAERGQHSVPGVVGVLGHCGERPRSRQHGAGPEQQHREHAMAHTSRLARIRDLRQSFYQRQHHDRS
ncbi:hypothetical protein GCM10009613_26920 [Pseudonocardia kongjuensis]|uniref:Uncharacterized protein n=1 Tax=Pseudonocardia kongjuensis TaxID=102227 RepID=A0ABN1XS94_9PSEU